MPFTKGNHGRPKGALNKSTLEIKALAQALFDKDYWTQTRRRLLSGRIAPAVEAKLLAYAYGEPKQQLEVTGEGGGPVKVVHEYHGA